jgi:geranylgeranylglycerol-phosphate geranylgeranyltransferase
MRLPSGWAAAARMIRPVNCLIAAASVLVGAVLAGGTPRGEAILAAVLGFLVCAGGYALNDSFDVATDRMVKPWRPLPSGALRARTARVIGLALWVAAGVAAMVGGRICVGFWLAWSAALWLYSWRAKGWGLVGHVVVSAVASSGFLLGAAVAGSVKAGIAPAAVAAALHLAREIAKGVADAKGDGGAGVRTLAVRVGGRRALAGSLGCIAGAVGLSLVPYFASGYGAEYLGVIVVGAYPLLGICVYRILRVARGETGDMEKTGAAVARLLKAVMPVGLVAFLAAGV